jgi:hypothetical protein
LTVHSPTNLRDLSIAENRSACNKSADFDGELPEGTGPDPGYPGQRLELAIELFDRGKSTT